MPVAVEQARIVAANMVISPEDAVILGDTALRLAKQLRGEDEYRGTLIPAGLAKAESELIKDSDGRYTNFYSVSLSEQRIFDTAIATFRDQLADRFGIQGPTIQYDVFVGTKVRGLWHFDEYSDVREMVNLTSDDLTLNFATSWDPKDRVRKHGQLLFRPRAKTEYDEVVFGSGKGVFIDNDCHKDDRVPHAGIDVPGKVMLHMYTIENPRRASSANA